jgi:hypothetical protein
MNIRGRLAEMSIHRPDWSGESAAVPAPSSDLADTCIPGVLKHSGPLEDVSALSQPGVSASLWETLQEPIVPGVGLTASTIAEWQQSPDGFEGCYQQALNSILYFFERPDVPEPPADLVKQFDALPASAQMKIVEVFKNYRGSSPAVIQRKLAAAFTLTEATAAGRLMNWLKGAVR